MPRFTDQSSDRREPRDSGFGWLKSGLQESPNLPLAESFECDLLSERYALTALYYGTELKTGSGLVAVKFKDGIVKT